MKRRTLLALAAAGAATFALPCLVGRKSRSR